MYYGVLVTLPYILAEMKEKDSIFGENDIIKLAISNISEVLAAGVASFLIDIKGFGRKNSLVIFSFATSISSLVAFLTTSQQFLTWVLAAKFFMTMNFIFSY